MLLKILEEIEEIKEQAIEAEIPAIAEELRPTFFCGYRDDDQEGDAGPLSLYWDYKGDFVPRPINLREIVQGEIDGGSGPEEWLQIRRELLRLAKTLQTAARKHRA
ncbi:MAG TPA: hypothetical protein DCZ11_10470 [Gammaproteobacteria bacterium]|jgi:hypothetical protein|nr:hypothetical protein [Gammaproteobacteria bacterium]MCH78856.1 hypothetical protein [Gammaproteobacteria bacterium]